MLVLTDGSGQCHMNSLVKLTEDIEQPPLKVDEAKTFAPFSPPYKLVLVIQYCAHMHVFFGSHTR